MKRKTRPAAGGKKKRAEDSGKAPATGVQSTKVKRVLRIVKVCVKLCVCIFNRIGAHAALWTPEQPLWTPV